MRLVTEIVADTSATLRESWFLLPNWKWIGLFAAIFLGFTLAGLFRPLLHHGQNLLRKTAKEQSLFRFVLDRPLFRPLSWVFIGGLWLLAWESLELPLMLSKILSILTHLMISIHGIRFCYLIVEALGEQLILMAQKTENTLDDQLAPFVTKTLKVLVVIFGALVLLQNTGVNVVSLLAGLGLGGLAIALAAQDTVANLIGSIAIILDRPFQVGDHIRVGDTEGIVEEVGFRSTRIRTPYKSLVSLPNSVAAKEKIDNLGARSSRRFRHQLGLTYNTGPEKIQAFCQKLNRLFEQLPERAPAESPSVQLVSCGDFSLNILVVAYLQVRDTEHEVELHHQLLLSILMIAKELQVEFAFPTQTVILNKT